jgi:hypothetical protein
VDVSDVNGQVDSKSSGGIGLYAWGKTKSDGGELARFDDILIKNCTVRHVDGEGIFSYLKNEGHAYSDTHVRLTGNTIEDTGRNAIYIRGTLGGMIDHNTIHLSSARMHGNALCIGWAKDNIVRANEISETGISTGLHENGAIDIDDGAIGTIVEFNWTHDNAGGSVNAGAQPGMDADDSDSIIRFNLSENDGERAFGIDGAITNTLIYNNTIYIGRGRSERILTAGQYTHYPQLPEGILFERNVIYSDGSSSFKLNAKRVLIDGNCYLGNAPQAPPRDMHIVIEKMAPLTGVPIRERQDATLYRLPAQSACGALAEPLPAGPSDFLGVTLDSAYANFRGAVQPR